MDCTDEGRIAAQRSQTYWLLSRLMWEQPSQQLLQELAASLSTSSDATIEPLRAAVSRGLESPADLLDLQVEFTRLLRGVGRHAGACEPYESMAREGKLFGDSTAAVAAAYLEAGYQDIIPDAGPPDHIATELRFMSILCYREMQSWQQGDEQGARAWLGRQRRFVADHLQRWLPSHCQSLVEATTHPFYESMAAIVADACRRDSEQLQAMCDAGDAA